MRKYILLSALILAGCTPSPPELHLTVKLTGDDKSIQINGFDKLVIADIGRDSSDEVWQSLLPVYKMPADTDLKDYQAVQPGKYNVRDSVVVFTPDTPFKQGQLYFLRSYKYSDSKSAWQYIRQKKRPGTLTYKDLLFKY